MAPNRPGRVLVLGQDMRIFLAVVRAFGRAGKLVHAATSDPQSPALQSRFISATHILPDVAQAPSSWRDALLQLLQVHAYDLVVPCFDGAILALDRERASFEGHRIAIPGPEAIPALFDKNETHRIAAELGIPICRSAKLTPTDTADQLAAEFGLPLVVKPRSPERLGTPAKVFIVESGSELADVLKGCQDRAAYLVESFFRGAGVGVSVLARQGVILQAFQHRRLREGRGGSSSYRISEPVRPDLLGACAAICSQTKLTGVCMFEFRCGTEDQRWVLLETNARFWGSLPLPISLGLDYPNLLFDLLVFDNTSGSKSYQAGIRSRNLVLDGFNVWSSMRRHPRSPWKKQLSDLGDYFSQPFRWLAGREKSDSLVIDDLKPALREFAQLPISIIRKTRSVGGKLS